VHKPEGATYALTQYVPPLIQVSADSFRSASKQSHLSLSQSCQQLALTMRQKSRLLSELAQGDESRLGHRVAEQHKSWIRAIMSELPAFELLADESTTHPAALYRSLAKLVGAVNAIHPLTLPPKMAAYQHQDCIDGFNDALTYLFNILQRVNVEYSTIEFEQTQSGIFSILFDKAWGDRDILIELIASENKTSDNNKAWMESARIVSASVIKTIATQRLLGASASFVEMDEVTGLKSTNSSSLFMIKADPRYVKTGQQLVIVSTNSELSDQRPAKVRLHLSHE
jgi:type VI secretion system protein ImpJ